MAGSYLYENLNKTGKAAYDGIVSAVRDHRKTAPAGAVDAKLVFGDILDNYPEFFWLDTSVHFQGGLLTGKNMIFHYNYSAGQVREYQQQLDDVLRFVDRELMNSHQSDYDKVLVLHDFLKKNVEYDKEAFHAGVNAPAEASNLVGALILHRCVCAGFSKAMKFLCDHEGIPCYVVSGMGNNGMFRGPHAWNVVNINGIWQHVDVTWDNQFMDDSSLPNYTYLNMSDEEMNRDHTWDRQLAPECPDDPYNFFRMNGSLIDSKAQLVHYLSDQFAMEEENILFRVKRDSPLAMEIAGYIETAVQEAIRRCRHVNPVVSYMWIPEQLVYTVKADYS